ncbi:MAG: ferredoxin [Candidatus Nanopelagicales bacterium]|nr:ferredoxin [Candidatus Nanopelagicales bacterium]
MKVAIDVDLCQGHGRCYEIAPEVFTDDDRGRGELLMVEIPADLQEKVRQAVNTCPERAITISE